MGTNPINLALRFLLELAGLAAIGYWGWGQGEGYTRYLFALGAPLVWAVIWGIFAVPGDPSRSGKAPVPVLGIVRLLIELAFFTFASWGLFDAGLPVLGLILAILVLIHYAISYDRVIWLVTGRSMNDKYP